MLTNIESTSCKHRMPQPCSHRSHRRHRHAVRYRINILSTSPTSIYLVYIIQFVVRYRFNNLSLFCISNHVYNLYVVDIVKLNDIGETYISCRHCLPQITSFTSFTSSTSQCCTIFNQHRVYIAQHRQHRSVELIYCVDNIYIKYSCLLPWHYTIASLKLRTHLKIYIYIFLMKDSSVFKMF